MITTDLTGNIGDHLVRYLMVRSVAEKNNYSWGINPVTSHDYYSGKEQMDFLEIDYGEINHTPYGQLHSSITNTWEEKIIRYPDYNYHPFQPDIFNVPDNTKLIIYCCHDARYYDKEKVRQWLSIKEEKINEYNQILNNNGIEFNENLCVINCRGGEYRGIPSLFLGQEYWNHAFQQMLKINPRMKFIVITEDPQFYKNVFNVPVYHFSIGCDYYVINQAKNLILSNSGFAIFPAWLNKNAINIIAPKYWSRHNISNGFWANSDIWTFGFNFMNRYGKLFNYEQIIEEERTKGKNI